MSIYISFFWHAREAFPCKHNTFNFWISSSPHLYTSNLCMSSLTDRVLMRDTVQFATKAKSGKWLKLKFLQYNKFELHERICLTHL